MRFREWTLSVYSSRVSNAVSNAFARTATPHSLSAQLLHLQLAVESVRRVRSHDRLPAMQARKSFRDATKLLRDVAEACSPAAGR